MLTEEPNLTEIASLTQIQVGADDELILKMKDALADAMNDVSNIDPAVISLHGMSGRKYRHFINNLIRKANNPHYLEIGSWAGSTLCSAISNNALRATAIDNWSMFGGPKESFEANLARFRTSKAYVNFIESDFRQLDYTTLGPFNVYLFDGPHEYKDQYDALAFAKPALADTFIFIVDDWNWEEVRRGTQNAITELNFEVAYSVEIRTSLDGSHPEVSHENSDWHNGYLLSVLRKA